MNPTPSPKASTLSPNGPQSSDLERLSSDDSAEIIDEKKLHEFLGKLETIMLATRGAPPNVHARPMRIVKVDSQDGIWLVTRLTSPKIAEIERQPNVSIISNEAGRYLSLQGTAEVRKDQQKVEELWNEKWKVWFPNGKADPEISFIVIRPTFAEYWDMSGANFLGYLWRATKAYAQGETPEPSKEGHGVFSKDRH